MLQVLGWLLCASLGTDEELFRRELQPLLSQSCLECHGAARSKGGLRLDDPKQWADLVVPGHPEKSELYQRLTSTDEHERMPQGAAAWSAEQIAAVAHWIEAGARVPADLSDSAGATHWAYRAPQRHPLPTVQRGDWVRDPIDAFVLAALEARGLEPAPPADWDALLRRVALDLTGLPPPDSARALPRGDPRAYEQFVDSLLASPHYGERMALGWLDLARYADTHGYEKDDRRTLWPWRDWVIQAFQSDLPYDQFTIEQLAGDLLPNPTPAQRVATGFHRNTLINQEGGTDAEEFRYAAVVDRVHTTATVWLGSTLACAQCHNHKFDPFSQRDYYRFFAFFNSTQDTGNSAEPLLRVGSAEQLAAWEKLQRAVPEREAALSAALEAHPARLAIASSALAEHGAQVELDQQGGVRVRGPNAQREEYTSLHEMPVGRHAFLALRLPLGRAANGNWALSDVRLYRGTQAVALRVQQASRVQGNGDFRAELVLDGLAESAWAPGSQPATLWLELLEPIETNALETWQMELDCTSVWAQHNLGGWSLYTSSAAPPLGPLLDPILAHDKTQLEALEQALPQTMVLAELPTARPTHRHERGAYLDKAELVMPDTPQHLPALPADAPRNRLGLARWLVSRENPLTARVAVNRVWEQIFGRGLVASSEDFGTRGDAPTHPELLDTLAVEWMDAGWSFRWLLRRIVLSNTYRQAAVQTPLSRERDAQARWLSYSPRSRYPAEILRDQALAVSGLLDPKLGGPSVFPYQPEGVWNLVYSGDSWQISSGSDRYRRGIYTFWKRSSHYASFQLFDAPSREQLCTRRSNSNTPLQALALLNDPAFTECARALAQWMGTASPLPETQVTRAFEKVLGRLPEPQELQWLTALHQERGAFACANVLLNLDEFLCRP